MKVFRLVSVWAEGISPTTRIYSAMGQDNCQNGPVLPSHHENHLRWKDDKEKE